MSHHAVAVQVRVPSRHCNVQGIMHASRPHEYFEDAFLAWLDDACGTVGLIHTTGPKLRRLAGMYAPLVPVLGIDNIGAPLLPQRRSARSGTPTGRAGNIALVRSRASMEVSLAGHVITVDSRLAGETSS